MVDPEPLSRNSRTMRLLLLGLIFHLVYIMSVFDCYFVSPVVSGMQHFSTATPEADRLVLIVGDGLRADLLFNLRPFPSIPNSPHVVAPYLRSVVETRGAFGVSHTRVPTESRPGHVAIIAGMYEDVSAVTKGWKTNPVDFDSVFNQSRKTFSFGSPDILPMFSRGAEPGKVLTWCYDEKDEDFTKDATTLDTWVLDTLTSLLHNATSDPVLDAQLRAPGIVFFLHLLGLDTTGHSYRPHSKEYMENIQHVDAIVQQTEILLQSFYGSEDAQRTAYIFTADHGMSNLGNHGDGDPDNTRTPLIAWGSGIRGPVTATSPSVAWNLTLQGQDVSQADIAPLMAALLGIPFPANSVGVLPEIFVDEENKPGYLAPRGGEEAKARAAVVNAKVILEQYRVKHRLKASHALSYKPFPMLEISPLDGVPGASEVERLERLLASRSWQEALHESAQLIETTLQGLRYIQTYDRWLLRAIVTTGYIGWAVYSAIFVLTRHGTQGYHRAAKVTTLSRNAPRATAAAIFSVFAASFAAHRAPWTYYLYVAFPVYFWGEVLYAGMLWGSRPEDKGIQKRYKPYPWWSWNVVVRGVLVVLALQAMVAGYTHRSLWSLGFVILGFVWPAFAEFNTVSSAFWGVWAASCLATGLFPLLSVEKTESIACILIGGVQMCLVGLFAILRASGTARIKAVIQTVLVLMSMFITYGSVYNLQAKLGLPLVNQISGWVCLAFSTIIPFAWRSRTKEAFPRLLELFMAFCPCYIILSISVEGMFYVFFSSTLVLWLEVEGRMRETTLSKLRGETARLSGDDVRIALFFLFFVQVAFFGTGNVASISSFYLAPVYRLVPVFQPFLMAALLIFKIVAPYVILSAAFATLTARLRLPPFSLFLIALSLTDGMTLTFFYNVTDMGSWLEIGQSISFFCITSLLLVWSAGVCATGEWLMRGTLAGASNA